MVPVLDKLILDVLKHHVEAVLHIILGSARHLFYDFRPFVSDGQSLLQDKDILFQAERVFLNLGIQEVDPALSALLSVPVDAQVGVQLVGYLTPLLGTVFAYQLNEFFVFPLNPVAFLDGRLLVLVELVLALGVVSARDESCDLYPVILVKLLGRDTLALAVLVDSPEKEARLLVSPILLGVIRLLSLLLGQLVENLAGELVGDGIFRNPCYTERVLHGFVKEV
mmetsp:Transcript_41430/g.63201  ORF Transcript_41430/g.63201 Transcript_41430/m.63201 type:complete len:224 (-) Transcript_41430:447-1118(-)